MKGIQPAPAPGARRTIAVGTITTRTPTTLRTEAAAPSPAQARQTRHALTALARTTPGRRRIIQRAAKDYLSQVERRRLPLGCNTPLTNDHGNRADAFRMRRGDLFARMLGLAVHPVDQHLPGTARAVLAALDAPVQQLTSAAAVSGQPLLVAMAHCVGAVRAAAPASAVTA